jgi:hypothetical protein
MGREEWKHIITKEHIGSKWKKKGMRGKKEIKEQERGGGIKQGL